MKFVTVVYQLGTLKQKLFAISIISLYMAINYCNEFLRESTEGKLKDRGVYDALQAEMPLLSC